jgi:uncharacterized protein YuzE
MKISYDNQVDALYIRFLDGSFEVTTQRLTEDILINYAPDGRVVGIEVLDASEYAFVPGVEPKIVVQNLVAVSE